MTHSIGLSVVPILPTATTTTAATTGYHMACHLGRPETQQPHDEPTWGDMSPWPPTSVSKPAQAVETEPTVGVRLVETHGQTGVVCSSLCFL